MTVSADYNDPQFDQAISGFHTPAYQAPDASPYGTNPHIPAHSIPTKPGLTRRGKTALTIGSLVLAGGGLITWQHHADAAAANALKAKQLQIQQDQINLQKEQAAAKANQANAKAQQKANAARQKQIDACVADNKGLVGKQLGYQMSNVIEDCQKQYPDTATNTADMQEAASSQSTGGSTINAGEGLLIGGGFLVAGLVFAARRLTRPAPHPQPQPVFYYPPQ